MTTIKATCPSCGDVDLTPRQVTVTTAPRAGWATYGFTCPRCHEGVTKSADNEVVTLLRGAGVRMSRLDVPAEALEDHVGPPLTYDDVLDFGLCLGMADALVALMQREARPAGRS